jgi:hypothetical protein
MAMVRRSMVILTVTAWGVLGSVAVPGSRAATTAVSYDASGIYDQEASSNYSYTGSATCRSNCTGHPASGTFTMNLRGGAPFWPPSPCVSKRVTGSLDVAWSDATTTTASISGRTADGQKLHLSGTITGGTAFPPGPMRGFVSYPPSPCNPGSFTGSFTFEA